MSYIVQYLGAEYSKLVYKARILRELPLMVPQDEPAKVLLWRENNAYNTL